MTLTEAAMTLGMSAETLRWQIHNGKLRAKKVGPIWTVTPREVERYRAESRRESHTPECIRNGYGVNYGCTCA